MRLHWRLHSVTELPPPPAHPGNASFASQDGHSSRAFDSLNQLRNEMNPQKHIALSLLAALSTLPVPTISERQSNAIAGASKDSLRQHETRDLFSK
jgi:hypothetical protein